MSLRSDASRPPAQRRADAWGAILTENAGAAHGNQQVFRDIGQGHCRADVQEQWQGTNGGPRRRVAPGLWTLPSSALSEPHVRVRRKSLSLSNGKGLSPIPHRSVSTSSAWTKSRLPDATHVVQNFLTFRKTAGLGLSLALSLHHPDRPQAVDGTGR